MSENRSILYLYTEVMGYTTATIDALIDSGFNVVLVHWDHKKLTESTISERAGLEVHRRSVNDFRSLAKLAAELSPHGVVVSGWQDRLYLRVCFILRRQKVKVVVVFDDQWFGTLKQWFGALLGKVGVLSLFFSHAWVAGDSQFEFARRLGFKSKDIAFDFLSADTSIFCPPSKGEVPVNSGGESTTYLYVGRFEDVKGIDVLVEAWRGLVKLAPWSELIVVGSGSMSSVFSDVENVLVIPFAEPAIVREYMVRADCALVPSKREPWGVVVHEFACSGLPIISADCVGANSRFLIHQYNGFVFRSGDASSLLTMLLMFKETSVATRLEMGARSLAMAARISPATSAANLLAAIE
jgi:glycosyltransferase involved in cell wall biosynthesis